MSFQSNNRQVSTIDRKAVSSNPKSSRMTNVNDIIERTSIMKISNNAKQAPSQSLPHKRFEEIFPQLPKAHAYNPYKIMGFQNKETNEFAMNALKTQAMNPNTVAMPSPQILPQSQPNLPLYPPHQEKYENPPPIHHIYGNVPPSHMAAPIQNFMVANTNRAVNLGPSPQSTFAWNFKIGDRCLAKYWEDENVSQKIRIANYTKCLYGFIQLFLFFHFAIPVLQC